MGTSIHDCVSGTTNRDGGNSTLVPSAHVGSPLCSCNIYPLAHSTLRKVFIGYNQGWGQLQTSITIIITTSQKKSITIIIMTCEKDQLQL